MTERPKVEADSGKLAGPQYEKGGDPGLMIFPENRPRDVHGSPVPTAAEVRAREIENERIAKEEASLKRGRRR